MKILLATSEAVPFAKTGGLADVCGALPIELEKLSHKPMLVMPAYRAIHSAGQTLERLDLEISATIGSKTVRGSVLTCQLPGSQVPVYFIEQPEYYDRPGLYQEQNVDYIDNCERFVFFSRAVLELITQLELDVDVLHANDWQTGLIPAYLALEYQGCPPLEHTACLFTIHNLSYQGRFWHWDMLLTGLDWKHFNWQEMEFYGQLNLLKTGLVYADMLTTVSPTYAQEIQTAEYGCGLEGVLQQRRSDLYGVLNGIDYRDWDPAQDPHLTAHFDAKNLSGKRQCKIDLQRELKLPAEPDTPLVALVGRLAEQKGIDLVCQMLEGWLSGANRPFAGPVQWCILGTGDARYESTLAELAQRYPDQLVAKLEFSNPLAHRIEAGADMFLMPSQFEPCGLNQMYSMRYGTVPIVRAVGGLADTVIEASPANLTSGKATGFTFDRYSVDALRNAVCRALELHSNNNVWSGLLNAGMQQDWSWARSASQYVHLYSESLARLEQGRMLTS